MSLQRPVVLCHGVFDVLHVGHLEHFKQAKAMGATLVVSVTPDRFVDKGPHRPHFKEQDRVNMVAALEVVDQVFLSDFPSAVEVIKSIRPDIYVKGPDYKDLKDERLDQETKAVTEVGGRIAFTSSPQYSSSNLINSYFEKWTEDQQAALSKVKRLGGLVLVKDLLDQISELSIVLTGEPIIDVYRFVEPQGVSSKSPTLSVRVLKEERYDGGVLAVQNMLSGFVNHVELVTNHRIPIQEKTRYIWPDKNQVIFESTRVEIPKFGGYEEDFCERLEKNLDLPTIVCDFGHGMFEGKVLASLRQRFEHAQLALNVQANSSNFGFNRYDKHLGFSYLCIDTREARLAFGERNATPTDLAVRLVRRNIGSSVSVTLGSDGSIFLPPSGIIYPAPAFSGSVVDATGAGDAYFAITSLLTFIGADPEVIPFIGNVFAGLKLSVMGHRTTVTKDQLVKALTAILK